MDFVYCTEIKIIKTEIIIVELASANAEACEDNFAGLGKLLIMKSNEKRNVMCCHHGDVIARYSIAEVQ